MNVAVAGTLAIALVGLATYRRHKHRKHLEEQAAWWRAALDERYPTGGAR